MQIDKVVIRRVFRFIRWWPPVEFGVCSTSQTSQDCKKTVFHARFEALTASLGTALLRAVSERFEHDVEPRAPGPYPKGAMQLYGTCVDAQVMV